jgi:hypothetical protein
MGSIVPSRVPLLHQAQVGLMHERRRLQRVIGTLTSHEMGRELVELVVDQGDELGGRVGIAVGDLAE